MKLKKLTALVTGMGLAAAASIVSAANLGEVWVTDQKDGTMYVYNQDELNSDPANASPLAIDLVKASSMFSKKNRVGDIIDGRNHLVGFNNVNGLDPMSRAHLAYLAGDMQVWKTHGKGNKPEIVFQDHIVDAANSLHMCGGSPDNTQIGCSSIGGKAMIMFSADYSTDTYTKLGEFPLASMPISASAPAGTAAEYATVAGGKPICNNYDTTSSYLYVTVNTGGLFILDVADPSNPEVINAYGPSVISATGCGLVNSQDGTAMWTNAGSKNAADDEAAYKWSFANIGTTNGPTVVDLPEIGKGDVHGAQFAGLGGPFLWELMRLDDVIYVVEPGSATIVNTIDLEAITGLSSPAGDVLDRSALGTRMYISQRGYVPITAIGDVIDSDRSPGVTVLGTIFGYDAVGVGHAEIRSGVLGDVCIPDDHGDHDHDDPECPEGSLRLDNADPHGLKALSYLSGGF